MEAEESKVKAEVEAAVIKYQRLVERVPISQMPFF
jgi:hypothetical protein